MKDVIQINQKSPMKDDLLRSSVRDAALSIYRSLCNFATKIWSPVNWIMEQINGTAILREKLRRINL